MFESILIANRGEIACRIIRTAKSMGLRTIAIYSSADKDSLHVRSADLALCVGGPQAQDSYLNIDAIVQAALTAKACAIHPGYGFLSENPDFAKACKKAGIVFIGPSVEAMQAMASKQWAKQLLEKKSIPLIPGYHGELQKEKDLLAKAKDIGFPVLIKAANGGGGKGMRTVTKAGEFADALAAAKRESKAYFHDDTVILEKLLINPRHVEVQIMADTKGNVVHLFERDCSIQRRHQKIIEEAPAPHLSTTLRNKLGKTACEVAASIAYVGAGTVEFLVDQDAQFYFMEMNTRLQVEHPVTEMITGLDLVACQISIAAGEPLPFLNQDIKIQGHAIECRIYAEDPYKEFIPSIGVVDFLKEPSGSGIRIDSGISLASEVSPYYDPMVAKLITHGKDRDEALQRMQQALLHYYIGGIKTNIPFLSALCQHPQFKKAALGTDFLVRERITLPKAHNNLIPLLAASYDYLRTYQAASLDPLYADTFGWQTAHALPWTARYEEEDGNCLQVVISPIDAASCALRFQDKQYSVTVSLQADSLQVEIDKQQHSSYVIEKAGSLSFFSELGQFTLMRFQADSPAHHAHQGSGQLTAPMPSTVVALLKAVGDKVNTGDKLIVLEAMKMEHTICAPRDGLVADIFYKVGDQVLEGVELVALNALDD